MAGKTCALWHPNQTKRHFERAADAQIANIKNQAVVQQQATVYQKSTLLEQIDVLLIKNRQEIENTYQVAYDATTAEFAKAKKIHEESLLALSFYWIYGKGIINAEHMAQSAVLQQASDAELQNIPKNNFYNLIFGDLKPQIISKHNQSFAKLATEKQQLESSFSANYKGAVQEEVTKFASYASEHAAVLEALASNRLEQLTALNEFIDAQKQNIETQYTADISSVDALAKQVINSVNSDLQQQLKALDDNRSNMMLNGVLIVGAALVAVAAPELLAAAVGNFAANAVQISAATTALGATNNLFNDNNTVNLNFTVSVPNSNARPYAPAPYKAEPTWQEGSNFPGNYAHGIELNPFNNNRISSTSYNYQPQIYGQSDNYSTSYGSAALQPKANISFTSQENGTKAVYQAPDISHFQMPYIEKSQAPKASVIDWLHMAWRSLNKDKSPEVINWQQNNRNNFSTTAAFFDGIANSKAQRLVNAFADEFAGRPIMFLEEEVARLKHRQPTQTAEFVVNTIDTAKHIQEFIAQDAKRLMTGDTAQTVLFFEAVGKFIEADFSRLREGQATVIGTSIAEDFKALTRMSHEELAAHLGHEIGDAFLLFLAGGGLQAGGRALTKTMDTAVILAQDFRAAHTFHSPLLFQFQEGKLYSGFPFDAVKIQRPVKGKKAAKIVDADATSQIQAKINYIKISELKPTHDITLSKRALTRFIEQIKMEGIQEPIKYVLHGDIKYIVNGHHRFYVARKLNLSNIPAIEVKLPYKGYKAISNLTFGL